LTTVRDKCQRSTAFEEAIDAAVRELDGMNGPARQARGEARAQIIDALARIDRRVLEASAAVIDDTTARALRQEAETELAPFGSRLAQEARTRAAAAAFERLVRETLGIPVIAYE
jgi:hypothetical protein